MIYQSVGDSQEHFYIQSFNRNNLEYQVYYKEKKKKTTKKEPKGYTFQHIIQYIQSHPTQTGIIYVLSQAEAGILQNE